MKPWPTAENPSICMRTCRRGCVSTEYWALVHWLPVTGLLSSSPTWQIHFMPVKPGELATLISYTCQVYEINVGKIATRLQSGRSWCVACIWTKDSQSATNNFSNMFESKIPQLLHLRNTRAESSLSESRALFCLSTIPPWLKNTTGALCRLKWTWKSKDLLKKTAKSEVQVQEKWTWVRTRVLQVF